MEAFGDCIEVKEEIHGFRWVEERDLSGFVDGTENPAGERRVAKWRLSKTAWMRAAAMCLSSVGNTT
ncbi:putative peroxidase [Escherichia coli]|uniref:Putative peroxidase n=1 Tax=Escherichia coli TaxID=562 RepID=A0A376U6H4_ECOLX|nr:putative peroxidase [Escherichia coli]